MTSVEQVTPLKAYLPKEFFYNAERTLEEDICSAQEGLQQFQNWLRGVPEADLHRPIAPGKWSPAEYADHVARANWLFTHRLIGHMLGHPLEDVGFGSVFSDGRVIAHAGTEPMPGRPRDALLADLADSETALEATIDRYLRDGRLDEVCNPHQYFGPLTARETMQLVVVHYQRHLGQLVPA